MLTYFTQVDANDQLTAKANDDVVSYRLPSYGRFFVEARPRLWFGMIQSVTFPGFGMDVDALAYGAEAKNNVPANRIKYLRQIGAAGSAAEHGIPEQLFRNPRKPADDPAQPQGISAVRVISIAASQGQKIYTLHSGWRNEWRLHSFLRIVRRYGCCLRGYCCNYCIDSAATCYRGNGSGGHRGRGHGRSNKSGNRGIYAVFRGGAEAGKSGGGSSGVLCGDEAYCIDQFDKDTTWCDYNFREYENVACHRWAGFELLRCRRGEPRLSFIRP